MVGKRHNGLARANGINGVNWVDGIDGTNGVCWIDWTNGIYCIDKIIWEDRIRNRCRNKMIDIITGNQPDVARSTCRKNANSNITVISNGIERDRIARVLCRVSDITCENAADSDHINRTIAGNN